MTGGIETAERIAGAFVLVVMAIACVGGGSGSRR